MNWICATCGHDSPSPENGWTTHFGYCPFYPRNRKEEPVKTDVEEKRAPRITYRMTDGSTVSITLSSTEGLISFYKGIEMNKLIVLVNSDGKFKVAVNPRHLVSVQVEE